MLMRRPEGAGGSDGRNQGPSRRGQGFFNAPWWRLLLWAVILVAAVMLAEILGILG